MEKTIGKSKVTEMLPYLKSIANQYGLKLHRAQEFKLAKLLLVNLYCY
jgi:hypothetical protein